MRILRENLIRYVEALSGEIPVLEERPASALPLYLRERYELVSSRILGRHFLLALEKEGFDPGSPGEYEQQIAVLRGNFSEPVVLVISTIPSYARNRMVHLGIPFIVPGNQMFLPMVMIDLRERFSKTKPETGRKLTPAAQCVLLYHLQRQSLENLSLKEIAEKVGYSTNMLTKVKDELEAAQLCTPIRQGKSIILGFDLHGRELWKNALGYLSSPVKKTHWLQWGAPEYPALRAGLTALSGRTNISDDPLPTYALLSSTFQKDLERGLYRGCNGPEEADVRMESWTYDPKLLSNGHEVDPLSLYLSLQDSPDDRIQQQLSTLISEISW